MPEELTAEQLAQRDALIQELYSVPRVRQVLEEEYVLKHPEAKARLPHLQAQETLAEVKAAKAEIDALLAQQKVAAEVTAARVGIMRDPNLKITVEELPAVEKIMAEEGTASHKVAAEAYRARARAATPAPTQPFGLDLPGRTDDAFYKGIIKDPSRWRQKVAHEMLAKYTTDPAAAHREFSAWEN